MKHPTGKLWKTELNKSPLWLLEWSLPAIARHCVLLAVDSTDSCGDHDHSSDTWQPHPDLRALLQFLARSLNPEDEYLLWLIGQNKPIILQKTFTRLNQSCPGEFATELEQLIKPVRGGTWLKDTLAVMIREAVIHRAEGMLPFLLVATDGEVFDAEALGEVILKERVGLVRLGKQESPQLEWLRDHTEKVQPTQDGLKEFLKVPARTISLIVPGRSDSDARFFSKDGELLPTATGSPWQIPLDARYLGMAFIGGDQPRPELVYAMGNVTEVEEKPLPYPVPPYLQNVIDYLRRSDPLWDRTPLRQLADALRKATEEKREVDVFRCPNPRCLYRRVTITTADLENSLFCCSCNALLLASDTQKQDELNTSMRWLCRIEDDESIGNPLKFEENAALTGVSPKEYRKACQIASDEKGTSWLALDLSVKKAFG